MARDLHNHIKAARGLSPVSSSDDTAMVSQIVDRQGFESCEYIILTGSIADSNVTHTILVEDGDAANLSDAAAVDDTCLLGTEAGATFQYDDDNEVRKIGYIGAKRYVRVTITPSGNASATLLAGVWILGHPRVAPQSSQS